jgi:hypothetical protein
MKKFELKFIFDCLPTKVIHFFCYFYDATHCHNRIINHQYFIIVNPLIRFSFMYLSYNKNNNT